MLSSPSRLAWVNPLVTFTHACFILFIILSFTTPSWRDGPFSWWPLTHSPLLAGAPVTIGLFNLLPFFITGGWLLIQLRRPEQTTWQWGRFQTVLPLLGLTILGSLSLEFEPTRRTLTHAGALCLFWLVYLFCLNQRPRLAWPLAFIVVVQGSLAIAQFALQRDLGLVSLGELPLNPAFEGITVLYARDQPWLRAYGLTAHPNLLGAILAMMLLWLLPLIGQERKWRQWLLLVAITIGLLGLFVTFSRSAWLAFGCGLLIWLLGAKPWPKSRHSLLCLRPAWSWLPIGLLLVPLLLLLAFNYDLVLSRFLALDTPIEAQSLNQRLADDRLALQVIGRYPWFGVGLGNYVDVAREIEPEASRVHNVPLYVTAESGILATGLWLWLMVSPFIWWWRGRASRRNPNLQPASPALTSAQLAAWGAMIIMNMFDTMVWWSSNWQTAILFALLVVQTTPGHQLTTSASHHDYGSPESPLA